MKIEIWSDVVCPFCYIGKRKFENALIDFEGRDQVEIVWKSFQLDPDLQAIPGQSAHNWLGKRKGTTEAEGRKMNDQMTAIAREVGLEYNFDIAVVSNTMDSHRLLHLAEEHGVQGAMKERLFRAYYTEGKDIGDHSTLVALGTELNIPASEIKAMLESDLYRNEVEHDQVQASQIGVQGVPFFVFNNKYAVSGAQPTHHFKEVLEKVWKEEKPELLIEGEGGFCTPDGNCS